MSKSLLIGYFLLLNYFIYPQDTAYYSVLRHGINLAGEGYSTDNFRELANICERISASKPDEWLPYYYGAYANINMSFIEKDNDRKATFCEKAGELTIKAKALNSGDSELDVLEALLCYAKMEINPMVNGMVYLPKANKALEEAKVKNPANPRIFYLKGKSTFYMPEFLGGGKKTALPVLLKAEELFNTFVPETGISPDWGRGDNERLLNECKKGNE
jgi:hypothetical protein